MEKISVCSHLANTTLEKQYYHFNDIGKILYGIMLCHIEKHSGKNGKKNYYT